MEDVELKRAVLDVGATLRCIQRCILNLETPGGREKDSFLLNILWGWFKTFDKFLVSWM